MGKDFIQRNVKELFLLVQYLHKIIKKIEIEILLINASPV